MNQNKSVFVTIVGICKRVSDEEEAEHVQKLKANQEDERRKEEEIVKEKEVEKLEKSRKKLAEKEEQLRKSEDQKENELKAAKNPLWRMKWTVIRST